MSKTPQEKICELARMLNKNVNDLTVYELMLLGVSYHTASKLKAMIRVGMIKCLE